MQPVFGSRCWDLHSRHRRLPRPDQQDKPTPLESTLIFARRGTQLLSEGCWGERRLARRRRYCGLCGPDYDEDYCSRTKDRAARQCKAPVGSHLLFRFQSKAIFSSGSSWESTSPSVSSFNANFQPGAIFLSRYLSGVPCYSAARSVPLLIIRQATLNFKNYFVLPFSYRKYSDRISDKRSVRGDCKIVYIYYIYIYRHSEFCGDFNIVYIYYIYIYI
jgi:hypothetical protein